MIIGISGKKQSGKSTISNIIQYFIQGENYKNKANWSVHSFADKIKQCVAIITDCEVSDLESEEFKNSNLDDNWDITNKCFQQEPLECDNKLKGIIDLESGCPKDCVPYTVTKHISYRKFLQLFGTEVCRQIHANTWINALFTNYKPLLYHSGKYNEFNNAIFKTEYPNWIITDVRFLNEVEAIKDRGGIIIRVNRNSNIACTPNKCIEHSSETELDCYLFRYTINNNGSIKDLMEQVKQILIKEKIILYSI